MTEANTLAGLPSDSGTVSDTPQKPATGSERPAGWGVDMLPPLPTAENPALQQALAERAHWRVPAQQVQDVEVLQSIEHQGLTPVFGSSAPPRGLSGAMRRFGFQYSENDIRHWLILLAADRIDAVEGVLTDALSGRLPNVPVEMGVRAELQHNPQGALRKAGAVIGIAAAVYVVARLTRRDSRR